MRGPTGFMEHRNAPRALRSQSVSEFFDEKDAIYFLTARKLVAADQTGLNKAEELNLHNLAPKRHNAGSLLSSAGTSSHNVRHFNRDVERLLEFLGF